MWGLRRARRFVRANRAFLVMHGCRSKADVVGRTDHDFHPPALATQYIAEDERGMRLGRPLKDQAWLVPDHTGMPASCDRSTMQATRCRNTAASRRPSNS